MCVGTAAAYTFGAAEIDLRRRGLHLRGSLDGGSLLRSWHLVTAAMGSEWSKKESYLFEVFLFFL